MKKLFKHYSDYQEGWYWKNFRPEEIACKCCGEFYLDTESMDALQFLRDLWKVPLVLTSAHRCPKHNAEVGGVESSPHLKIAFDCAVPKNDQMSFIKLAEEAGFMGIGRYPSRNFVHLDKGTPFPRRWLD